MLALLLICSSSFLSDCAVSKFDLVSPFLARFRLKTKLGHGVISWDEVRSERDCEWVKTRETGTQMGLSGNLGCKSDEVGRK